MIVDRSTSAFPFPEASQHRGGHEHGNPPPMCDFSGVRQAVKRGVWESGGPHVGHSYWSPDQPVGPARVVSPISGTNDMPSRFASTSRLKSCLFLAVCCCLWSGHSILAQETGSAAALAQLRESRLTQALDALGPAADGRSHIPEVETDGALSAAAGGVSRAPCEMDSSQRGATTRSTAHVSRSTGCTSRGVCPRAGRAAARDIVHGG